MKQHALAAAVANTAQMPDTSGVHVKVASALLSRSVASIWRDIKAGRLKAFRIGGSTRIELGSIRAVIAGAV